MTNTRQYSLYELQVQVKNTLEDVFAGLVWIRAEIGEITVNRSGHCYLDLVETEPGSGQVVARARATIWSYTFRMLKPYFETTTGQAFTQGIKILFQAKVEYHEVFGFSLNVRDIDPAYTMGDLARQRREILRKLEEEGVLEMNKELELPLVPQKIAIVSSPTAAGLQDFLDQLHNNPQGFIFYTKLFPAVMQGSEAAGSIIGALERIYGYDDFFDAVVIIRGGGAQIDLACFDNYDLAYHVTQFPLPVLTGIGHDKDDSVVDLVAHTRLKTPTAVAEFLISGVNAFATKLSELEQQFLELVTDQIAENRERLADLATELNYRVLRLIQIRKSQLDLAGLQLNNSVGSFLKAKQAEVRDCAGQTQSLTTRFVTKQEHGLEVLKGQLLFVTKGKIYQGGKQVEQWVRILKIKTFEQLRFEKQRLSGDEEKLRLIDPQNIIRRGFSINLRNGKIIKSVDQIEVGDLLETLLSDGTVESKVINKQRYGNEKRD